MKAVEWRRYLLYSYESQKVAAQGNDADIEEASPLNLLIVSVFLTKSTLFDVAWSRVLIASIGKSMMSTEVPAMPPASTDVNTAPIANEEAAV